VEVAHPFGDEITRSGPFAGFVDGAQVRLEIIGQRLGIGEGHGLGPVLDEEVERVDDLEVGDEADVDAELAGAGGKHQPGQEITERVLLPVDEVVGRLDLQ
jgi:hypothetical protein